MRLAQSRPTPTGAIASSSVFNIGSLNLTNNSVLFSDDLANNTFNMPIYVPYIDVAYLANNASFTQIEINNNTILGGTLNLNLIGTNASMSYVFSPRLYGGGRGNGSRGAGRRGRPPIRFDTY